MVLVKHNIVIRTLHWISAIVIIWASLSGLYAAQLSVHDEMKHIISFINVSLTTLFIPLFIFRLSYKYSNSLRRGKVHQSKIIQQENKIASIVHHLMYVIISIVLITGVLMMQHPINVFNWFTIPHIIHQPELHHFFEQLHKYSCQILVLFVVLHVSAVIKHEISGLRILKRMLSTINIKLKREEDAPLRVRRLKPSTLIVLPLNSSTTML